MLRKLKFWKKTPTTPAPVLSPLQKKMFAALEQVALVEHEEEEVLELAESILEARKAIKKVKANINSQKKALKRLENNRNEILAQEPSGSTTNIDDNINRIQENIEKLKDSYLRKKTFYSGLIELAREEYPQYFVK